RAERADYLPQVSLFGSYVVNAQQSGSPRFFGGGPEQRFSGGHVGVQLSIPLFNGFARPARVGQQRAAIEQVRTQQDLAEDRAEDDIRTLMDQVAEALARTEAQSTAVEQARRGYEIAGAEFREGLGSRLQVTDAE